MAKKDKSKRYHDKIKKEQGARKWVPPSGTAPSPPGSTFSQRRQPASKSYTAGQGPTKPEKDQRTLCLCGPHANVVYDRAEGREYCLKCGKRPRKAKAF